MPVCFKGDLMDCKIQNICSVDQCSIVKMAEFCAFHQQNYHDKEDKKPEPKSKTELDFDSFFKPKKPKIDLDFIPE